MNDLKLSIIVPIYNGADYLADCLASIECQTLEDFEVLCVDDASTDASSAIIASFASQDSRFKHIALEKNQGVAAARNYALSRARGEFVVFIDCDDQYPENTTLEKLYRAAADHGVDAAGGSFSEYDTETGELRVDFSEDPHLQACFIFNEEGMVDYRDWQGDYGFQRFIFRRQLLLEHGIEFPLIARHEDPIFMVKALCAAKTFYAIPDVCYYYRVDHSKQPMTEAALEQAIGAICDIIELSVEKDLPILRKYQYDLLQWYALRAPVKREYGSWKDIRDIVQRQAKDSLRLRIDSLLWSNTD